MKTATLNPPVMRRYDALKRKIVSISSNPSFTIHPSSADYQLYGATCDHFKRDAVFKMFREPIWEINSDGRLMFNTVPYFYSIFAVTERSKEIEQLLHAYDKKHDQIGTCAEECHIEYLKTIDWIEDGEQGSGPSPLYITHLENNGGCFDRHLIGFCVQDTDEVWYCVVSVHEGTYTMGDYSRYHVFEIKDSKGDWYPNVFYPETNGQFHYTDDAGQTHCFETIDDFADDPNVADWDETVGKWMTKCDKEIKYEYYR
jgi:hypothetical protein